MKKRVERFLKWLLSGKLEPQEYGHMAALYLAIL